MVVRCLGDALLEAFISKHEDAEEFLKSKANSIELKFDLAQSAELLTISACKNLMKSMLYSNEQFIPALKNLCPSLHGVMTREEFKTQMNRLLNLCIHGYSAPTSALEEDIDKHMVVASRDLTGREASNVMEALQSLSLKYDEMMREDNHVPGDYIPILESWVRGTQGNQSR